MRNRIHIPIGIRPSAESIAAAMIIASMFALAICCPGKDLEAQTKKMVVAQSPSWKTDGFAISTSLAPQFVSFSDCLVAGASSTLLTGDAFRVKDVGNWQCGTPQQFYLLPEQPESRTFLRFDDGHSRASFDVPPVGAIMPGGWLRLSPVVNDADFVTSIDVLPTNLVRVFIEIYDAHNHKIATESFDASAPVGQYQLKAQFKVGSLVLTTQQYGCVGCAAQPLYGFVTVSSPDGGSARVLPF